MCSRGDGGGRSHPAVRTPRRRRHTVLYQEHLPGGVWSGASRRRDGGGQDPSTVLQRRPAHERRHVNLDVEDLGDGGEKCTCVHAVEASTASFLGERLANAFRSAVSIVQPGQLLCDSSVKRRANLLRRRRRGRTAEGRGFHSPTAHPMRECVRARRVRMRVRVQLALPRIKLTPPASVWVRGDGD